MKNLFSFKKALFAVVFAFSLSNVDGQSVVRSTEMQIMHEDAYRDHPRNGRQLKHRRKMHRCQGRKLHHMHSLRRTAKADGRISPKEKRILKRHRRLLVKRSL
jgi:hypothetical protein